MFSFIKENFLKIKSALKATSSIFSQGLSKLFINPWSEDSINRLEELLYKTDMGSTLVEKALQKVRCHKTPAHQEELENLLIDFGKDVLKKTPSFELKLEQSPTVILIVGTNGSGKTTFCAKLAKQFLKEGKSVIFGAADTFRAAAVAQLEHHATCLNIPIIKHRPGADPAAVCFDTIASAIAKNIDVVILDSAGRLEHKLGLMNELKKISLSCHKALNKAPHYTLLNLDASLGQSALIQAKAFHEATPISGLILSKFDGSPKGGILLSIAENMKLPIAYLGTGETYDDITNFNEENYLKALFKSES